MRHRLTAYFCLLSLFSITSTVFGEERPISDATQECLGCHGYVHAGIVAGWAGSRHAQFTPGEAMKVEGLALKVSNPDVPETLRENVVGCAECHTMRPEAHADTFDHNGYEVHVVVSPDDCQSCHLEERQQYAENIMAYASTNLSENALYNELEASISGHAQRHGQKIEFRPPDSSTQALTCYYCHGTVLKVTGSEERETDLGEMSFPTIEGWPNQGTGRINLDGSRGACTPCHARHTFSIELARKPETCKECHVGPDVPIYKVYSASKHGNIYAALKKGWNFTNVPWTIGQDFTAPTCATCHVSLLTNADGEVVTERSHRMNDRLAWRLFGLIYAHPYPKTGDTTIIRNSEGQPLPTSFDGTMASEFLIDEASQKARRQAMQSICRNCHSKTWIGGHFARLESAIERTNAATLTATTIMQDAWATDLASGLKSNGNPFDEAVEKKWGNLWLFYSNSIRFTAAMAGGGDYSLFADGYYQLSKGIVELNEWWTERNAQKKQ
jgi:hypothetical protein